MILINAILLILSSGDFNPAPRLHSTAVTNYKISPLGQYDNGYPESKFDEVIQTIKDVYGPIISALGGRLEIEEDWTDGAVNMWAERHGNIFWLEIPGGMSRYHLINEEGFILSICHELGHLLGGSPQRGQISLEGQSDYYASKNCIMNVLPHVQAFKKLKANTEVDQACKTHGQTKTNTICKRTLLGALSLTSYYAELEKVNPPKLSTPSGVSVAQTLKGHPPAQCRLDTFRAGLFAQPRPSCWFKKKNVPG